MKQVLSRGATCAGVLAVCVASIAACATTTAGSGSGSQAASVPARISPLPPPPTTHTTPVPPPTVTTTHSVAPVPHGTPVTVTGLNSGTVYRAQVYGTSKVTDCASHSYGAPMINFFERHPCDSATRRIFTIPLQGRTVALSTVAVVAAPGPGTDYYKWAGQFAKLEKSDGTGSINDLLREGYRIPGAQDSIPNSEAFDVVGQDDVVLVMDAWYVQGGTADQDPALVRLEEDLFLTSLTSP